MNATDYEICHADLIDAVSYSVNAGLVMPQVIRQLSRPELEHALLAKITEFRKYKLHLSQVEAHTHESH